MNKREWAKTLKPELEKRVKLLFIAEINLLCVVWICVRVNLSTLLKVALKSVFTFWKNTADNQWNTGHIYRLLCMNMQTEIINHVLIFNYLTSRWTSSFNNVCWFLLCVTPRLTLRGLHVLALLSKLAYFYIGNQRIAPHHSVTV